VAADLANVTLFDALSFGGGSTLTEAQQILPPSGCRAV
jgi:hypothetical protein